MLPNVHTFPIAALATMFAVMLPHATIEPSEPNCAVIEPPIVPPAEPKPIVKSPILFLAQTLPDNSRAAAIDPILPEAEVMSPVIFPFLAKTPEIVAPWYDVVPVAMSPVAARVPVMFRPARIGPIDPPARSDAIMLPVSAATNPRLP
jgi:hypothetical protein